VTYADLLFMQLSQVFVQFDPSAMEKYPTLSALAKRVEERPNIKKWLETRPKTQF